jgi:hypothetical protein
MMIVHPAQLFKLLATPYDVVHIVMPANLSGMWILAAFKILRCIKVRYHMCSEKSGCIVATVEQSNLTSRHLSFDA